MKKYLIALDLDGTLLTDSKVITEDTKKYLKKVIDDGHKVVISTGRPYSGMIQYYNELNLDTPIVNCNGGVVHHPKDPNFKKLITGMDQEEIKKVFKEIDEYLIDAYFNFDNDIYYTKPNKHLEMFIQPLEDSKVIEGPFYETVNVNPSGIVVLIKPDCFDIYVKHIKDNYTNISTRLFHRTDEYCMCEVYQKDVSKATGLELVLDYFNMTSKDLIAIGDGDNDVEMLEYAYVGVAMSNGEPHVIDCAKYITRCSNNEDGVIWFLDHFIGYNTMK